MIETGRLADDLAIAQSGHLHLGACVECYKNAQPGTGAASLESNNVFSTINSPSLAFVLSSPHLSLSLHRTFPIVDPFRQRPTSASFRMGILDSSCVTAGPRNMIYAFAQVSSYGNSTDTGRPYYVIAKSTNPPNDMVHCRHNKH